MEKKKMSKNEYIALEMKRRKQVEALQDSISLAITYLSDGAPVSAKDVLQRAILKPKA